MRDGTLPVILLEPWTDGEGQTCCLKGVEKEVCPSSCGFSTW